MTTNAEEIRIGTEAEHLLNSTVFRDIFDRMYAGYEQAWRDTKAEDKKGREKLWFMRKQLAAVEAELRNMAYTKAMAIRQNQRLEAMAKVGRAA